MTAIETAMAQWALLDENVLSGPWSWRDKPVDVRYALYRTLEDAQEALVPVAARPHPESRRIVALAQRAFGDLRGLLIGLPDDLLDRPPGPGAWSVRETLRHVLFVECRYALQTAYAIERTDVEPMRIDSARLPELDRIDASGDVSAILSRLAGVRTETNRRLDDVPPARMTRPAQWMHYDVDVRFRLHRLAAHVVEHTIQCEKTLSALGWRETEGRRVVRRIWTTLGELEGLGALAEVRAVERLVSERLASMGGA